MRHLSENELNVFQVNREPTPPLAVGNVSILFRSSTILTLNNVLYLPSMRRNLTQLKK